MSNAVSIRNLNKIYCVRERAAGFSGALSALYAPRARELRAVDAVSFEIERGERVAFIEPNGAGKSTTIKMLCGSALSVRDLTLNDPPLDEIIKAIYEGAPCARPSPAIEVTS